MKSSMLEHTINISLKPYPKAKEAAVVSATKALTGNAKCTGPNRSIRTEYADTCVIVGLNAAGNNCLMHLAPELQSTRTLADGILKNLETLLARCGNMQEKVTGFIFGGRDSSVSKESNILYTTIANILDDFNIPFTMICGKKANLAKDNVNMVNKNTTIWNSSFGDELVLNNKSSQEEIQYALEELYEAVEISPEVPVKFIESFEPNAQRLLNRLG